LQVFLAEHAGFCNGVKKALELTLEAVNRGKKVSTLGPLVHNDEVNNYLTSKGVKSVDNPQELDSGTVIIRTHGISPQTLKFLQERKDLEIIDATCPNVRSLQKIASRYLADGYEILIFGSKRHPEVQAVLGWTEGKARVIEPDDLEMVEKMRLNARAVLVSQTTQREDSFYKVAEILKNNNPDLKICPTICRATALRQYSAAKLASTVDLMLVVGDEKSSNTGKLTQVCREIVKTHQITGAKDISAEWLMGINSVGVAAGASTPPWTIKEVMVKMENGNLEARTEEVISYQEADGKDYHPGDVITGKVVLVEEDQAMIDIGYKSEAVLPRSEVFLEGETTLKDKFSPGDDIDLLILKVNYQEDKIIVSQKRLQRERRWKELVEAVENGLTMKGIVKEIVPAGIIIDLGGGIEGFMPGSLVDVRYIPDFQQFMGQEFSFKVIELNRDRDKVILSRKQMLEEEAEQQKRDTLEKLKVGEIVEGVVKRLTDFGAFVDVGGIDGLVHISEVSWQRVGHPQDVLKVGEQIKVKVLEIIPERERISLSIRQAQPDPWSKVNEEYKVGDIIKGKVTRIVNFGAFVELIPGVEGLVHISQMADFHVKHPSEIIQEGEEVEAKILDINLENKRISLSIKKARPAPRDLTAQSLAKESGENQNVTLGDVFGDLFNNENSNADTSKE
jgi:4-hydroxy-3-methylbut-2-enyl diphosphate reductase